MKTYKELLNKKKSPNSLNIIINVPLNNDENVPDILEGVKRKMLNLSDSRNENMNQTSPNLVDDITKEKKTMKPHPECSSFESMEEIESYHSFINKLNVLPLISDVDKSVNSTKTSQVKSTEIFANMHKNTNGTGTTNVYKGSLSCNDSLERKLVQKKRTKKEKRNGPLNTSFINNFNNLEIYCTSNKLKHKLSVSSHSIAENGTCNTPLDEDEVTKNDSTSLQGRAENLLKQGTILDPSRELSDQSQYRLSSTLNSEQGNTRSEDYPKSETEERLYCYSSSNEGLLENTNELNKKQISFGESFKSKKKRKQRTLSDNSCESTELEKSKELIERQPIFSIEKVTQQNLYLPNKTSENRNDDKDILVYEESSNTHMSKEKKLSSPITRERKGIKTSNIILLKEDNRSNNLSSLEHINETTTLKVNHKRSKLIVGSDNEDNDNNNSRINSTYSNLGMEVGILSCTDKLDDNKKRRLKDLYKQASKQYKRLKIADNLPNVETDNFQQFGQKYTKKSTEILSSEKNCAVNTHILDVRNDQHVDINISISDKKTLSLTKKLNDSNANETDLSFLKNSVETTESEVLFYKNKKLKKNETIITNLNNDVQQTSANNNINFINSDVDSTINIDVSPKEEITSPKPQHSNKENKKSLLCEDSSEDEKDLSGIMNYLKTHAKKKLVKFKKLKLNDSPNTNYKKQVISKTADIEVNLSKSDSSDSSLDAHVVTLRGTRNKKENIYRKKQKPLPILTTNNEKLNQTEKAIKSSKTKLETIDNGGSKNNSLLQAKLVDSDSSNSRDSFINVYTAELEIAKNCDNSQQKEILSKGKQREQYTTEQTTAITKTKTSNVVEEKDKVAKCSKTKMETTPNFGSKNTPLKAKLVDSDCSNYRDSYINEHTSELEIAKYSNNAQQREILCKGKERKKYSTKQNSTITKNKTSNEVEEKDKVAKSSKTKLQTTANNGSKKNSFLKANVIDAASNLNYSKDCFTSEDRAEFEFHKTMKKTEMSSKYKESKKLKQNTLLKFLHESEIVTTKTTAPKANSNISNETEPEASEYETLNIVDNNGLLTKTKNVRNENSVEKSPKKVTKGTNKQLVLDYFDKVLSKRENENKQPPPRYKSKEYISDSEDSELNVTKAISEFETDKDSDEECKTKMIEMMSYVDDELLNTLEENEQLANLKINISWDIPISHTIETRISSCPTKEQKKLFKDLNIKIIDGPFTMVEDKIIKKNFKEFCLEHGLNYDPTPFLNLLYGTTSILKTKERIKFARYLGRGLEFRKLYSIYRRFKVLYSTMKKGRFRPEEDAVIMEYMQVIKNSGNQFSALSKILNRPRSAIEKRYRTIQRQTHSIKPKDYAVFIKTLVAVAGCNNLFELKDRSISDEEWTKVAQILNFKKRNLQVCWMASLYTKLFHHGPINVDDIMSNLIEKLYEEEEDDYRNLNWTELALPFKNVTGAFLYRLFKRTRQTVVPLHLHKNLRKTIVAMKTKYGKNKEVMPQIDNIVIKL